MKHHVRVLLFVGLFMICGGQFSPAQMNGEAARDWLVVFRDTLQHTVLPFWIDHALDKEYGGLLGQLNREGMPTGPGDKSVVLYPDPCGRSQRLIAGIRIPPIKKWRQNV